MDDSDTSSQLDGLLRYRQDADGTRVGVIPSNCKVCGGPLLKLGFRARQRDGVLIVDCAHCANLGIPGHAWQFIVPGTAPDRVELDYNAVVPGTRL